MPRMTENAQGALLMVLGMAAFTVSDVAMKAVGMHLPLFQSVLLRGVLVSAAFLLIGLATGALAGRLAPPDRRLMALRVLGEVGCAWFFFLALFQMPLANLIAILQATPLAITLVGALFLGERVGWRRWALILVGFAGVLLIVRPGTEGFDRASAYALVSAAFIVLRDLATRRMSASIPSLRVAFWSAFGVTLFGAAGSLTEVWVTPTPQVAGTLALAAVAILFGYLLVIQAVRRGDLSVVTPYRYTGLVWALALGWLIFGEWPDALAKLGALIIVAAGLATIWRERQLAAHTARTRSASTP